MARLAFCDYHNMVAILEKHEHNVDFHQIVDFVEPSHIRYALTINPTIYVSHIRQFWSTARIETTDEGTKILATVDGKPRTIFESSIKRNLKLHDEAGISSLLDAKLFENLTLMGVNSPSFLGRTVPLFESMLVPIGEGLGTPTEPQYTPSPEAQQSPPTATSSLSLPPVTTESLPTVIPTKPSPHLRNTPGELGLLSPQLFPLLQMSMHLFLGMTIKGTIPLPVGTLTVATFAVGGTLTSTPLVKILAASREVSTFTRSFMSLLPLSVLFSIPSSSSVSKLLPLIVASSPDGSATPPSLSSNILILAFKLAISKS
nr:hypothetical protein [Tanacetum cinerariifolium]